jgi:hypothetical protein
MRTDPLSATVRAAPATLISLSSFGAAEVPADLPWAIEYPLAGDDLLAVTRRQIDQLRSVAVSLQQRATP